MSTASTKKLAIIAALIDRYRKLPRHRNPAIGRHLGLIREVQVEGIESVYADGRESKCTEALKDYYVTYLHSGVNLDQVASDGDFALKLAARLDDTFDLLVNALEFGVTAQELDDALLADLPSKKLKAADIKARMSGANQLKARLRHAELLRPLGPGLAPYASSRFAYMAFKIAVTPVRATSLAPLIDLLARGFDVLRELDDVEPTFEKVIANNKKVVRQLYAA